MKISMQSGAGSASRLKTALLALSGAGALLAGTSAQATDEVYDSAGVSICCFATADTTAVTTGAGAFLESNAASFIHFSPNYDPVYDAVASTSTSNVTNLTSGGVSVFFPGLQGKYPYLPPASGVAFASSDLGAGQVHAAALSEHPSLVSVVTPPGFPPPAAFLTDYYSTASADARFSTDFTVNNTTNSDFLLKVSWRVDGVFGGPVLPLQVSSFLGMRVDFNNYSSSTLGIMDYEVDPVTGQISTSSSASPLSNSNFANQSSTESFANSFTVVDLGGDSRMMTALFDIRPGMGVGTLQAFTKLVCGQGATCDYRNTSSLSFGALPAGVSFTFDAPGFLGGYGSPTGGVPEPASWATMLVGLGGAGAVLRRVRRKAEDATLAA